MQITAICALAACVGLVSATNVSAQDSAFPQTVRLRYEASDLRAGGQFIVWSQRERIQYGVYPRISPPALYVEVTQLTPSAGSPTLTFIEVRTIHSAVPEYVHLAGNVLFRVSGMALKAGNFPAGGSMTHFAQ